ncbi:MAG: cation:proton antiporter [Pseudohongiellaceae bacterium]
MNEAIFQQFLIIISFSLLGAMIFGRLKMTTIVAYMAVGALIGPNALGLIADPSQFQFLAEFGVVFLLFSLGLEFSLAKMLSLRFAVFVVGGFQVVFCTALFAVSVYLWGASLPAAIVIGGSLALSSTAIVTRELHNSRQLHNLHGQLSVAVLLFQDLVAVVFLVLIPVFGDSEASDLLPALGSAAINSLVLIVLLLAIGRWVLPLIYAEVAKQKSEEVFVLSTLVIVLMAAWITHSLHLSMALGGFIIGMMLAEGPFRHQIEIDIRPFRNLLLGLFFVSIGMGLDVSLLIEYFPRILLFTLVLVLVKAVVVMLVVELLGYTGQDALKVGINLSQAGEFGMALLALAMVNGILAVDQGSFIILIIILSMLLSPALLRYSSWLSHRLRIGAGETGESPNMTYKPLSDHVVIGGFGRLGTAIAHFLEFNDISYIAIDSDIEVVTQHRGSNKPVVFGDSNNIENLNHCSLSEARLVVLTFKSLQQGKATVQGIRKVNPDIPIIVRCQESQHSKQLLALGANYVFPELFESSLVIVHQILSLLAIDPKRIDSQISDYRERHS